MNSRRVIRFVEEFTSSSPDGSVGEGFAAHRTGVLTQRPIHPSGPSPDGRRAYRSVAITGAIGTGIGDIARQVAARLDLACLDDQLPTLVAARLGLPPDAAREFDGRLPSGVGTAAAAVDMFGPLPGLSLWSIEVNAKATDVHRVTAEVFRQAATTGAVVVGRGAAHVLAEDQRVMKVRLVAERPHRVAAVASERGLDRREASRLVRRSDRRDAAYVRAVHRGRVDDRRVHDLRIDVTAQSSESVVRSIVLAALTPAG